MTNEFTPGAWAYTATVSFHDRPDLPCVVDEQRLVIAQCWDDGHSPEECEANARLIAEAPALFKALAKVVAIADRRTSEFDEARAVLNRVTKGGGQ